VPQLLLSVQVLVCFAPAQADQAVQVQFSVQLTKQSLSLALLHPMPQQPLPFKQPQSGSLSTVQPAGEQEPLQALSQQ
jgi:hypothetical protein